MSDNVINLDVVRQANNIVKAIREMAVMIDQYGDIDGLHLWLHKNRIKIQAEFRPADNETLS